jgi:excisionase family DNA binding protein
MQTFKEVRDELEKQVADLGLITIREAADIRGVSRSAILQLIQRGRLKTETVLGKHLIYKDALEGFEEQRPGPAPNQIYKQH